ncbi:MAG: hypothetical protein Fur0018_10380 [Anaerolineales bacterium]
MRVVAMMKQVRERFPAILPGALAFLGGMVYFLRALQNVHQRTSFLDEGLYLYKGWLYATGRAVPFADYAPWTNHMPLSFLIPGYVQKWFGPDLAVGRYFSVALGLLFLLGLWLVVRRWAGTWPAAGAVWAFVLNLASIKLYSMALPEVLVAAMLAWLLFFVLRTEVRAWQAVVSGLLGVLILLTRINMAPVLLFLAGYVWWQHGRRAALYALGAAVLAALGLHLLFWPGILKLWAAWLPKSLTPFLAPWRLTVSASPAHTIQPAPVWTEYWLYLWESLRLHFLTVFGALTALFLWPVAWREASRRRGAVSVGLLLGVLYLLHLWVAFTGGFCTSCIVMYETYFDFLGLVLLALVWPERVREAGPLRTALVLAVSALAFVGLTYAAASDIIHSAWYHQVRPLLEPLAVWRLLAGRGGVSPGRAVYYLNAALLALLIGGLALALWRRSRASWRRFAHAWLLVFILTGALFTPTRLLGSGNDFFACGDADVPASYRQAGAHLRDRLLPGAQIAWVGRVPALFLYLPDVRVYPPQLNHYHSFWTGGDADSLYRFGRWNEALGMQWMQEADYTLIEEAWLQDDWVQHALQVAALHEVDLTPPVEACRPEDSRIHVFTHQP